MGYNLVDGPVASPAGRVPEGGRNAEGFSFDAYLSGIAMGEAVQGMNSAGVITAGRHFLFNEQETNRMTDVRYSSNVDEKTAQEIYLWPFADGVRAGMTAVSKYKPPSPLLSLFTLAYPTFLSRSSERLIAWGSL